MSPGGRRLAAGILGLGVLATAAIVGASVFLESRADDATSGGVTAVEVPVMEAPTGAAAMVASERIVVTASSFLAPSDAITYEPGNTIDGDPTSAWNSDAPDTQGVGQILTYRFTEPVDLRAIRIINGYAKNDEIYAANHRIKALEVQTDAGSQLVNLLDTTEQQEITFDFGLTSKVVIEVLEVYTGDGFTDTSLTADLALSEIDFLAIQR